MKAIIFYGTECDETTAWIPWIKTELVNNGINCIVPKLPTPENQTYNNWSSIINNLSIDAEDIIIAWSTGAIFAVRYLFENHIKVKKLILISGFNNYIGNVPFVDNINKDFFMKDIATVKGIANNIVCIKSDNDPFISQEALNSFIKQLNAKEINVYNGGHFNANAGYTKFYELLDEVLNLI